MRGPCRALRRLGIDSIISGELVSEAQNFEGPAHRCLETEEPQPGAVLSETLALRDQRTHAG